MAEGYLRQFAEGKARIYSAGVEVHGVNPRAIAAMGEEGIDISHHTSNHVDEYRGINFDYIITVCDHAREVCPYFPSAARRYHHDFPDPARFRGSDEEAAEEFRRVRALIRAYCQAFVAETL